MPRDLPIGNERLLVLFDDDYVLRDLYYPNVGKENHAGGYPVPLRRLGRRPLLVGPARHRLEDRAPLRARHARHRRRLHARRARADAALQRLRRLPRDAARAQGPHRQPRGDGARGAPLLAPRLPHQRIGRRRHRRLRSGDAHRHALQGLALLSRQRARPDGRRAGSNASPSGKRARPAAKAPGATPRTTATSA